jgi:cellulose synthase/poly-beta-1,6-N-acetylglucosamine synthase-like glycosyltransferase
MTLAVVCGLFIVVIWFGYPLAIAAISRFSSKTKRTEKPQTRHVSVIIATLDGPETIRERVRDIFLCDYPAQLLEVVIGLDMQGDTRPSALQGLDPRVRVVVGAAPGGKAATLNTAVAASTGEILVFADSAQRFAVDTIRKLSEVLDDGRIGAVSGALQIGSAGVARTLTERYWQFEKWLRQNEAVVHSTVGVTGAVYAMQRSCWLELPAGLILDDVYGPMQLVLRGYRVGFRPDAHAFDERRFAPGQEYRRKARTLTGVVQLCMWLPAVLLPWRNPIWAQFLFHKLLRLTTPYLLLVMLLAIATWLITTIAASESAMAIGLAIAAVVVTAVPLIVSRRLRAGLMMVVAMQIAVVRATVNGLRGHWDVWSR